MSLHPDSDRKYHSSRWLGGATDWEALRVEHRQIQAGAQSGMTSECTELVIILSGEAPVRRTGDGQKQEAVARPGNHWLVPAGTHETQLELDGDMECLHIFMPATLLEHSALADYGLNPDRVGLAYEGGFIDPVLSSLGEALRDLIRLEACAPDRMLIDGLRTALAGRLIGSYSNGYQRPPFVGPALDPRRLQRVLDLIEASHSDDLSLDALASEACLSPFHFARLFRQATGLAPHRYLTDRRIKAAKAMLERDNASLVEIGLCVGLGGQANFTRAFRKTTGMTPGQYRAYWRQRSYALGGLLPGRISA